MSRNYPDDMEMFDNTPGSPYYEEDPKKLSFEDDEDFDYYAAYQESLLEEEQYQHKQDILHDRH